MILKSKIMLIVIVIIIIVVAVVAYFYFTKSQMSKNEMRFTGKITAARFDGKLDGPDYITVNGIEIELGGGKGSSDNIWGKIIGIDLSGQEKDYIGKTVKVYATKYISIVDPKTNTFTNTYEDGKVSIEGKKDYFVEVIQ